MIPHRYTRLRHHPLLRQPAPKGAALAEVAGLVIWCQNQGMLNTYRNRARALLESGNANNRRCKYCHRWDSVDRLVVAKNAWHQQCQADYCARWRKTAPPKERRIRARPERNAMWREGR